MDFTAAEGGGGDRIYKLWSAVFVELVGGRRIGEGCLNRNKEDTFSAETGCNVDNTSLCCLKQVGLAGAFRIGESCLQQTAEAGCFSTAAGGDGKVSLCW